MTKRKKPSETQLKTEMPTEKSKKYRSERGSIQETSISLMDDSILETQTSKPDGGQTLKRDSDDG